MQSTTQCKKVKMVGLRLYIYKINHVTLNVSLSSANFLGLSGHCQASRMYDCFVFVFVFCFYCFYIMGLFERGCSNLSKTPLLLYGFYLCISVGWGGGVREGELLTLHPLVCNSMLQSNQHHQNKYSRFVLGVIRHTCARTHTLTQTHICTHVHTHTHTQRFF